MLIANPIAPGEMNSPEQAPDPLDVASTVHSPAEPGIPAWTGWLPRRRPIETGTPLIVCVHGISRDYPEQIARFRPEAERRGYALLAPHFDENDYPDFQRLGRRGRGHRADLGLFEAIRRFRARAGDRLGDVFLVGFSGGAQFAHRFVMAHPHEVRAAVMTAAGWYTMPSPRDRYPRGLRVEGNLSGVRFEPDAFLRIPMLVAVGAKDTLRDETFRTSERLDAKQGRNRVERAHAWSRAMTEAARKRDIRNIVRTVELPGAAHSFPECIDAGLDRLAFDFFDRFTQR